MRALQYRVARWVCYLGFWMIPRGPFRNDLLRTLRAFSDHVDVKCILNGLDNPEATAAVKAMGDV